MKDNRSLFETLRSLLSRLMDSSKINESMLQQADEYLFSNKGTLATIDNAELLEVLVYLKEIMVMNSLKDLNGIELYYENKKKQVRKFIDAVVISPEAGSLNKFAGIAPDKIDWVKMEPPAVSNEPAKPVTATGRLLLCSVSSMVKRSAVAAVQLPDNINQYQLTKSESNKCNTTIIKPLKSTKMAKNGKPGDGHRNGAVDKRSQVLNPATNQYVKRDTETGRFMDVKTTGDKFKGVRKEK